jgi:UDP-N-acetylmuramyl tripeptide synthase
VDVHRQSEHPPAALPRRTRVAAELGGVVARTSRGLRRGGGSVIGGRVILAVDPRALERLSEGRDIAIVSGTNGKTTTTRLVSAALGQGAPVVSNVLGANLPPGLAAALAGSPPGAKAVLEVDEAWLGRVVEATSPRVVALLNLSRDQLDRNNEVRRLSAVWRTALALPDLTVVANADDPLVVWGAERAGRVVWVAAGLPWTGDAAGCPACGGRISFPGDGGAWACEQCSLSRPGVQVWIEGDDIVFSDGRRQIMPLALPGRANRANAAVAVAVAAVLGVPETESTASLREVSEIAGRYASFDVHGVRARLLLAKNPAGWLEVFDLLRPAPVPVVAAINARIADGKDPSWLWDVAFERLRGRFVVATGERCLDLAVRLRYTEVEHICEPDLIAAIARAGGPEVDVVANYTSFQQLRARLR